MYICIEIRRKNEQCYCFVLRGVWTYGNYNSFKGFHGVTWVSFRSYVSPLSVPKLTSRRSVTNCVANEKCKQARKSCVLRHSEFAFVLSERISTRSTTSLVKNHVSIDILCTYIYSSLARVEKNWRPSKGRNQVIFINSRCWFGNIIILNVIYMFGISIQWDRQHVFWGQFEVVKFALVSKSFSFSKL